MHMKCLITIDHFMQLWVLSFRCSAKNDYVILNVLSQWFWASFDSLQEKDYLEFGQVFDWFEQNLDNI